MDDIRTVVSMLIELKTPKQIIFFGSYVREEQAPDPDLDLMVIVDTLDHQGMELVRYPPMLDMALRQFQWARYLISDQSLAIPIL